MAGSILESKLVIGADDKTGAVFTAVEGKINRVAMAADKLSKISGAIGTVGAKVDRAASSLEMMSLRVERVEGRFNALHRAMNGISNVAVSAGAAIAAAVGAHEIAVASASRVHEKLRMEAAGMSADEIGSAEAEAAKIAAQFPSIGQTEAMHMLRNARSIVGSYQEAAEIMEPLAKLRVIAQANRPGQDVSEDFDQLVKGLEIKGVTQDRGKFKEYMEGIAKGLNVFGDTLKPYQYYEMFKYGRQATPALSERFILGTASSLAQELGGSSYGKAVSAFNAAIVGGIMKHSALQDFLSLGLTKKEDLLFTNTGEAKGLKPGKHIEGWRLAQSDPNEWIKQYLLPAIERGGVHDKEEIIARIGALFQNQSAAQLVSILATQQTRINKDLDLLDRKAKGLEASETYQSKDPAIAFEGLKHSIIGAGATVGADIASSMAPAMNDLAKAIAGYTQRLTEMKRYDDTHPGEDTAGQRKANRWLNYLTSGILSDAPRDQVPLIAKNDADYAWQHEMLSKQVARPPSWLDSIVGEPAGTVADRNRLASIESAHNARIEAQNKLTEYQSFFSPDMSMRGPPGGFTMPGLQAVAKLDGQANINVSLSIDAPPELLALLRAGVSTTAFGDVRADTGTSRPDAAVSAGPGR